MLEVMQRFAAVLWVLATAAAFAACSEAPPPTEQRLGKGVYVPETWQRARDVPGHTVHVVEKHIPCVKCHDLSEKSLYRPSPDRCAVCHEAQAKIEHAGALATERLGTPVKADCTNCHVFTVAADHPDAAIRPAADDCRRCHAEGGKAHPARVHASTDCLECHRPHSDRAPTPHACAECHADVTSQHATKDKPATEVCTTCHQNLHGLAAEAREACARCHAEREPKVPASALFDTGHRECVGCHRPHGKDEPERTVACTDCHGGVPTLGATRVTEHRACQSCHTPHDVLNSPDRACSRCHTGVHPDHPKHGQAGTCVGCHDPHPAKSAARTRARTCSSCHQAAQADTAFHGNVACRRCHAPHTFVSAVSSQTLCAECHQGPAAATSSLMGHGRCTKCHQGLPHRPARLTAPCATCHAGVASRVNQGHTNCRNCHEPHGGKAQTACKSCHAEPHRTAPAGHQKCTSCHDKHTGSSMLAACGGCHAKEAATPHGKLGAECQSCHRPHGPKGIPSPPACSSCHAPKTLPGLHAVGRHDGCRDCHSSHGERKDASRASCLPCHADKANHNPGAPNCGSCHLFGRAR